MLQLLLGLLAPFLVHMAEESITWHSWSRRSTPRQQQQGAGGRGAPAPAGPAALEGQRAAEGDGEEAAEAALEEAVSRSGRAAEAEGGVMPGVYEWVWRHLGWPSASAVVVGVTALGTAWQVLVALDG